MTDVQTGEAARRLGITTQWVGRLIAKGELKARSERRGKRTFWLVDERSIADYRSKRRRSSGRPRPLTLKSLQGELASLRQAFEAAGLHGAPSAVDTKPGDIERERDDLRAEATTLRDALARTRESFELQRQADEERAAVIEHLTAAIAASERADELRRRAVIGLDEALAAALGPRHPGGLSSGKR